VPFAPAYAGTEIKQVAAGDDFSCALDVRGGLHCWGRRVPEPARGVRAFFAGGENGCTIDLGGGVSCFGKLRQEDVVNPDVAPRYRRFAVGGVVDLDVSGRIWARRSDGTMLWWGATNYPAPVFGETPSVVPDMKGVVQMAQGCFVLASGDVQCWSDPSPTTDTIRPEPVVLRDARSLAHADGRSCAVLRDDSVMCWGSNCDGMLGDERDLDGDEDPWAERGPRRVASWGTVQKIVLGKAHACALLLDGTVRCAGDGTYGQLGQPGDIDAQQLKARQEAAASRHRRSCWR
jgi:alpha-tubulin suppressor-like RCC1 family protein